MGYTPIDYNYTRSPTFCPVPDRDGRVLIPEQRLPGTGRGRSVTSGFAGGMERSPGPLTAGPK